MQDHVRNAWPLRPATCFYRASASRVCRVSRAAAIRGSREQAAFRTNFFRRVPRIAELAALHFEGVPEFQTEGVAVATPEWRKQFENYRFDFKVAVRCALVILGQSKEDLVSITNSEMEGSMQFCRNICACA